MSKGKTNVRKRLADSKEFAESGKKLKVKVSAPVVKEQPLLKQKLPFKPNFEKPITRSKTVNLELKGQNRSAQNLIHNLDINTQSKRGVNLDKINKSKKTKVTVSENERSEGRSSEGSKQSDKSNNNAVVSDQLVVNPDPTRYVLTKWGDVHVLGKRKIVKHGEAEHENSLLEDGIEVMVDTDEFGDEDLLQANSSSDDEVVQLGGTAEDECLQGVQIDNL